MQQQPGYYFFMSPELVTAWAVWGTAMTGLLSVIFGFIITIRKTSAANSSGIAELRATQLEIKTALNGDHNAAKEPSNGVH